MNQINTGVSVDCVLLGYDGKSLKVLLINQDGKSSDGVYNDRKLPGGLIFNNEDLDQAAYRILKEYTGLEGYLMQQYGAYGSLDRTKNPKDVLWLEHSMNLEQKIERIVTVAYATIIKIDSNAKSLSKRYEATWMDINDVGVLAFDHNRLLDDAVVKLRTYVKSSPAILFELLPKKFTLAQLRILNEVIYGKRFDVRNFAKKVGQLKYVVALEEYEEGVSHRAAQYFRFDKNEYRKQRRIVK